MGADSGAAVSPTKQRRKKSQAIYSGIGSLFAFDLCHGARHCSFPCSPGASVPSADLAICLPCTMQRGRHAQSSRHHSTLTCMRKRWWVSQRVSIVSHLGGKKTLHLIWKQQYNVKPNSNAPSIAYARGFGPKLGSMASGGHEISRVACAHVLVNPPYMCPMLLQTLARENRREYGRLLLELWVNQVRRMAILYFPACTIVLSSQAHYRSCSCKQGAQISSLLLPLPCFKF